MSEQQTLRQFQHRIGTIESIKMDTWSPGGEEFLRLFAGISDPDFLHSVGASPPISGFKLLEKSRGDAGAAERDDALDDLETDDRQDAGNNRFSDAEAASLTDEVEIELVVEEELGHDKIPPLIDFEFEIVEVGVRTYSFGMGLRIASHCHPDLGMCGADKGDQIRGVLQGKAGENFGRNIGGEVPAQGQDIVHPGCD